MQMKGKSLYALFPKNSPWFDSGWWIGLGQLCPDNQNDHMPLLRLNFQNNYKYTSNLYHSHLAFYSACQKKDRK